MPQFARLLDDHANLIQICEALLRTISEPIAQPAVAMRQLSDLAARLNDHLAVEEGLLADARQSGSTEFMPLAVRRGETFCNLVTDWVNYLRDWPERRVQEDWAGFAGDTLDIIRRLIMQIEFENDAVRVVAHLHNKLDQRLG